MMLKNYLNWYKANKNTLLVRLIIMLLVITVVTFAINIITAEPILKNIDFPLFVAGMYLGIWLLYKYIQQTVVQYLLAFMVAFIVLTLQMFSDGSYVDYTSFIVVAGTSAFFATIIVVIIKAEENKMEKIK